MSSPFFTVLTPTYNRAHTLRRAFDSLVRQTFRDFEWLIVDDGSTDNTREEVEKWIQEAWFPARYLYQEHKHKKGAFNFGVREASGYMLAVLDSDDEFLPHALETFYTTWQEIPEEKRERFVGVTALCVDTDGRVVGDLFPQSPLDASSLDVAYFRWRVKGEKSGCLRVDILRRFPFPEDVEGFVPESVVWDAIARAGYLARYINIPTRVYHDSSDSLSRAADVSQHAEGLALWMVHALNADLRSHFWHNPLFFVKRAALLTRYHLHMRDQGIRPKTQLTAWQAKSLVTALYPLGALLYYRDKWRVRRSYNRKGRL